LSEQTENLGRVYDKIAELVLDFCRAPQHQEFHMADLVKWVRYELPDIAPDSPSRILRALRQEGRVLYHVVNRAQSLYRVQAVAS